MGICLFAHNLKAYNRVVAMLDFVGKAAVIHPTGTGKSFIAFKLIEDNPGKYFLWISPSEYIFRTQCENLSREAPVLSLSNVRFLTYAKLSYLTDGELATLRLTPPDYIILDEYHRGGAPQWEKYLFSVLDACPQAKLLGLSATNIRYLDNRRDMAQEIFDGYIASELSLGDAIVKGILPAPKYVMALYQYDAELVHCQRRIRSMAAGLQENAQRMLDSLKRVLQNADGLDAVFTRHIPKKDARLIVFCANLEHMQKMQAEAKRWFQKIDSQMHIYCIYSDNPEASRNFENFKTDRSNHLKLLFCIDMLNEGIHVADLDGIIMLRPTVSPIVYKQQLGRALSVGSKKTPLIFDIVNNFDGLYNVSAIGREMTQALQFWPNGEGDAFQSVGFTLVDETREARRMFRQLDAALSSSWELHFQAARTYFLENGNLSVPRRYITEGGLALGMWLQTQRRVYNGSVCGNLTDAQIVRLEAIGMAWDNHLERSWKKNYEEAKRYYEEHGNLLIPARYKGNGRENLGGWIVSQRQAKANGKLAQEQVDMLEEVGMVWNYADEKWEIYYLEALQYFNEHGDLLVPRNLITPSGVRLGAWLRQISRTYEGRQPGAVPLTRQQIQSLEDIGMVWGNRNDDKWKKAYTEAKLYYAKHRNLQVPMDYTSPDGIKLGKWITVQRTSRKKGRLSQQRVAMLDIIGMDWRMNDPWEHRYYLVQQYQREHGNLNIPAKYKTSEGIWLGNWLYRQKVLLQEDDQSLSEEQRRKLKALFQ